MMIDWADLLCRVFWFRFKLRVANRATFAAFLAVFCLLSPVSSDPSLPTTKTETQPRKGAQRLSVEFHGLSVVNAYVDECTIAIIVAMP